MNSSKAKKLIEKLEEKEVMRRKEILSLGISASYLYHLLKKGIVEKAGYGLYTLPDNDISENYDLIEAVKKVPKGVICLISALNFYQLTTQLPNKVWIAINVKKRITVNELPLRIVYMTGDAFNEGIEEHTVSGNVIKVYNPAKTIADCFKYRNKIGLDVAIEGLKEYLKRKNYEINDLLKYSRICRVDKIIMPYIEALI